MRKNTRRRQKESFNPQPTPDHHNRQFPYGNTSRDSDASFASSRPSLVGVGRSSVAPLDAYTDRSQQGAAVRSINSYLNSHSSLLTLRTHPISSSKEIIETLQFLIHQLDYPVSKIEDELFSILKLLNCPFKVNKSALRAPNTPHNFPSFLALIHWLVQIATCKEHLAENSNSFLEHSSILVYSSDSYLNYIRGDDESVEALDREFIEKLENDRNGVSESVNVLRTTVDELAAKAEALKSRPTEREKLEKEKGVLKEDVTKFHAIIEEFNQSIKARLKVLEEKSNALQTKVEEKKRIDVENEELKKQVENQSFNARDAERMKRELQAVERDIGESETARNVCEEKIWDLDSTIAHKLKELEALSMSCNQEAKRLKFDNIVQFALNAKGSTPAEVMGIDYKSTIKPKLGSFADDIKQRSVSNLEEVTLLQKQSSQLISKIDSKRIRFSQIQSHIDEMEAQMNFWKKETEDYLNRCALEAKNMVEVFESEAHNLVSVEREATAILQENELKLQDAMKQSEEKIKVKAGELFILIDSISKYKEHMDSRITGMKNKVSETVAGVSDTYKGVLPVQLGVNASP